MGENNNLQTHFFDQFAFLCIPMLITFVSLAFSVGRQVKATIFCTISVKFFKLKKRCVYGLRIWLFLIIKRDALRHAKSWQERHNAYELIPIIPMIHLSTKYFDRAPSRVLRRALFLHFIYFKLNISKKYFNIQKFSHV